MASQGTILKWTKRQINVLEFVVSLQVASSAPGRGVLRLLLVQQQVNLLCIPALILQLLMVASPSLHMPPLLCLLVVILLIIIIINRTFSDIAVALGRCDAEDLMVNIQIIQLLIFFTGFSTFIKMPC